MMARMMTRMMMMGMEMMIQLSLMTAAIARVRGKGLEEL